MRADSQGLLNRVHHALESTKIGTSVLNPVMDGDIGSWHHAEPTGDAYGYGVLHRWTHASLPLEVIVAEYRTGFNAVVRITDRPQHEEILTLGGGHGLEYAQSCALRFMLLEARGLTTLPALGRFPRGGWFAVSRCGSCRPSGQEAAYDLTRLGLHVVHRHLQHGHNNDAKNHLEGILAELDRLALDAANVAPWKPCHMGSSCPGPSRFVGDIGCSQPFDSESSLDRAAKPRTVPA